MTTTLAPHLRTLTVAQRGIDTSAEGVMAVEAWYTRSRAKMWQAPDAADRHEIDPTVNPTYTDWAWVLNFIADAQGKVRRVWPSNDHWDSPEYYDAGPGRVPARSYAADKTGKPIPYEVPWGKDFRTGTAPPGVDADLGALIDRDAAGTEGWAVLGMRLPNGLEQIALRERTGWPAGLPGLAGFLQRLMGKGPVSQYRDGDYVADGLGYCTEANATRFVGRGGGRVPKRRGVVTDAELTAGEIGHCVSVTMMNFEHGPGPYPVGPPRFTDPSTRTEHPNVPGSPFTSGVNGQKPGDMVRHGQGYAFVWDPGGRERWLDSRGYTGELRRTANTFGVAYEVHGWEGVETCKVDPQAEATLTAAQWATHGVTSPAICGSLMDGMWKFGHVVALRPAAVGAVA